jgi:hypothetical protein
VALSPTSSRSAGAGSVTSAQLGATLAASLQFFSTPPAGFTQLLPFTYTTTAADAAYPDYAGTTDLYGLSKSGAAAFAANTGAGKLNDGLVAGVLSDQNNITAALGWQSGTPVLTCDLGASLLPLEVRIYGLISSTLAIVRPSTILLERSDDNSAWTTFESRSGLTAGTGNGVWEARFDVSGGVAHRYWRFTLTRGTTWVHVSEIRFTA